MKIILIILLFSLSLECHSNCKTCYENSNDDNNMKCISCKNDLNLIFNTSNCGRKSDYPGYYLNKTNAILFPCSYLREQNCYECEPYQETKGKCLSCDKGYVFDNETNECKKCKEDEFPIIKGDFTKCKGTFALNYCNLFTTYCNFLGNKEIICPNDAPIFDEINHSCSDYECKENGFDIGLCTIKNKKYKDRIIFINWLKNEPKYINFPSYNVDNSGYLLIEMGCELDFDKFTTTITKSKKRKLFFFNQEGRGLFDEVNDVYEKFVSLPKNIYRGFSTSIALRSNHSNEYSYFLNFENINNNIDFFNLETGEISSDNFFDIFDLQGNSIEDLLNPSIQLLELNNKNQSLIASLIMERDQNSKFGLCLIFIIFTLNHSSKEKIDVYSIEAIKTEIQSNLCFYIGDKTIDANSKFFIIQTKKGKLITTIIFESYILVVYIISLNNSKIKFITYLFNDAFHKLINIKDEINLLCYYSNDFTKHNYLSIDMFQVDDEENLIFLLNFKIKSEEYEGIYYYTSDLLLMTETRVIFATQHLHGKKISIYVINFFGEYKSYIINKFNINIFGQVLRCTERFSLLFKYKDLLGFQIQNTEGEHGFILFGYFNSTDPGQIYNIKKDGLNYSINLGDYLNLQSNIFEYEIKNIKIIDVPSIINSGLYLISNNTKNLIQKDESVELNTKISLFFSYNGEIKKGKYLFKFAGVLQEPTFDITEYYSDEIVYSSNDTELNNKYMEEYNNRRNLNITGKAALVQINVFDDIKVFCDTKYDDSAIKNKEGEFITCGDGKFYDVENMNEITQLNLGPNYYFDSNNNFYIKCHERCKKCSRKYNDTNMNCDECFENFFLRDDNCLEISKCDYNYYYDSEFNLKCINREASCPDFKPFENKTSKECIKNCDIDEFNQLCNPTNNLVSINETRKKILDNENYLNLKEKLFMNKEKYVIVGNNVTFIFTTSDIELNELANNYNTSSIILNEFEDEIKQKYLIPKEMPIPILKIETLNSYSNNLFVSYELFNPFNLNEKLDLNLISQNYVEIRIPLALKKYKMDLIIKTKNLGYNIFDLNDSFYHEICSVFSYNNSDISLSERQNLLDLSDENLCQNNCNHSNFDIETLKSICICQDGNINLNNSLSKVSDISSKNFDKDIFKIIAKNIAFSKASNIKVIKCFSVIFNKNLFTKNYGFYILFFTNLINIIILILCPISKVETQFEKFCYKIVDQMEQIYNKIDHTKEEINLNNNISKVIKNAQNNNKIKNLNSKKTKKKKEKKKEKYKIKMNPTINLKEEIKNDLKTDKENSNSSKLKIEIPQIENLKD